MRARVDLNDVLIFGKEANHDETSHARESVHGSSTKGVVNLELEERDADKLEDNITNDSSNDSGPRL